MTDKTNIGKTNIERRTFVRGITAASGVGLSSALLPQLAAAQPAGKSGSAASGHFEAAKIKTDDNKIFIRRYGKGPPVLMVHGFPRTSLMWRDVAPKLASNHTVICVDLRGYGRSGIPAAASPRPSVECFRIHVKGMVGSPGWFDGFPEVGRRPGSWRRRWAKDLLDAAAAGENNSLRHGAARPGLYKNGHRAAAQPSL